MSENLNIDWAIKHPEDYIILQELEKQNSDIDVYFFYEKYFFDPGRISRAIRKFEELKIISSTNEKITIISLTDFGKEFIKNNREKIFSYNE
jgi:DNA-binding PadR family transcriptional regulator